MIPHFLQSNTDPREDLIPRAPDIDGDLPSGDAPSDASVPDFTSGFSDLFSGASGGDFWASLLAIGGIGAFIGWLWSIYTFLAYLISIILIVLYIYATIKKEYYAGILAQELRDAETAWNQTHRRQDRPSRLEDVLAHATTENPNDWKLAIIEADIILDQTLKERGYIGSTLGERLRSITPSQMSTIDDAWAAHVVRNKIAHEGADFVLTRRIVDETIGQYRRVFAELDVQ